MRYEVRTADGRVIGIEATLVEAKRRLARVKREQGVLALVVQVSGT